MRLPKVALSFAALALSLSACGDPDEGSTGAFMETTAATEESSEAEASTNMTAADMPQTTTTDATTTDTTTTDATTTDATTTDSATTDTTTTATTTGGGNCGNGVIDMMEQCDGGMLNGFGCVDLGFSGGTLACDGLTCTYDSSNCTSNPGTTG